MNLEFENESWFKWSYKLIYDSKVEVMDISNTCTFSIEFYVVFFFVQPGSSFNWKSKSSTVNLYYILHERLRICLILHLQ